MRIKGKYKRRFIAALAVYAAINLIPYVLLFETKDGPKLITCNELSISKKVFLVGATTAIAIPIIAYVQAILRKPIRIEDKSKFIAKVGVWTGIFLMLYGIWFGLDDGPEIRTWDQRRVSKRIFYLGATTAIAIPIIAYVAGLHKKTLANSITKETCDKQT